MDLGFFPSFSILPSITHFCQLGVFCGTLFRTLAAPSPSIVHVFLGNPFSMTDKRDSVSQLVDQLSEGFAALSGEYQLLFDQHRQLESKLSWAKQQYLDLLKRSTPDTLPQDHLFFLQELEHVSSEHPRPQIEWVQLLSQSEDAGRRSRAVHIRQAESALARLRNSMENRGVKIWSGPSADKETLPIDTQQSDMSHMEKDFTTPGTPSKLGCPFASGSARQTPLATPRSSTSRMSFRGSLRGRRSKRPSFTDPIRAEICGNDHISAVVSGSGEGSAAVCPIRFLDQHAPEEVATYFQKHKHEIPRSHEVCIKRFQSNAESIQQLDRKYGNLVSMIQGLGQKHQAWLPKEPGEDEEDGGDAIEEPEPDKKVEKWANAVTASLNNTTPEEDSPGQVLDEARTAHFDRPLKEIRVGESPSRPWGIPIPAKYTSADSSSSVGSAPTASPPLPIKIDRPLGETPGKPSKCPFDHRAMGKAPDHAKPPFFDGPASPPEPEIVPAPSPERTEPKHPVQDPPKVIPQMVFNGPVFLGYPPDQLMSLLQNSNLGGMMR
ncbi:hypothetical protein CC78DRAFT_546529 [Lojkania enalia]|uniref:Uncharacterized protein n=1 Tax=Lojkania enalia TaxID=147567 RepID=A0A9P4MXQ5_9PLEO|nr:hypothetical protein CC78DRAFT_546529 [Didymosphaeria enalia]